MVKLGKAMILFFIRAGEILSAFFLYDEMRNMKSMTLPEKKIRKSCRERNEIILYETERPYASESEVIRLWRKKKHALYLPALKRWPGDGNTSRHLKRKGEAAAGGGLKRESPKCLRADDPGRIFR